MCTRWQAASDEAASSSDALWEIQDLVTAVSSQITQIAGTAKELATTGVMREGIEQINTPVQHAASGSHLCRHQPRQPTGCARRITRQFRLAA